MACRKHRLQAGLLWRSAAACRGFPEVSKHDLAKILTYIRPPSAISALSAGAACMDRAVVVLGIKGVRLMVHGGGITGGGSKKRAFVPSSIFDHEAKKGEAAAYVTPEDVTVFL